MLLSLLSNLTQLDTPSGTSTERCPDARLSSVESDGLGVRSLAKPMHSLFVFRQCNFEGKFVAQTELHSPNKRNCGSLWPGLP